jgi:heme/copper-type cytochrome/quinol oxidase subunit 1
MSVGATFILAPSFMTRWIAAPQRYADPIKAFTALSQTSTVGYVLSLIGLMLFAATLGYAVWSKWTAKSRCPPLRHKRGGRGGDPERPLGRSAARLKS